MSDYLSVSEAADKIGVKPRDISGAIYDRKLDADRCPIVAGRRLIPADYIPAIEIEMRRAGKLPPLRWKVVADVG
jgi:hypothetical protein